MAVVPQEAELWHENATNTGRRIYRATSDAQDYAAGALVTITLNESVDGITPPDTANIKRVRLYRDDGVLIREYNQDAGFSGTIQLYLTDTGLVGGSPRCGTVEIAIYIEVTGLGSGQSETDGSPDTLNTSTLDRGWIRANTTLVEAVSNVALGGAKSEPAEFDESLYVRLTCGAISYVARALAVASSTGGVSGNTNSTTAVQRDATFANVVDDRFAAALSTIGWTITVPNASLTGLPDWTHTTTTDDDIDVDPRIDVQWHLQKDQASFDTSYHDATFNMLASEVGQVAAKFKKRRTAGGINGLSISLVADPTAPGSNSTNSSTTSTRDSEAGWSDLVDVAPTGKPGGVWTVTADVTAPSDADLDTLLVGASQVVTVLAPNPSYAVLCGAGSGTDLRHFIQGDDFVVGGGLVNGITGQLLTPSGSPTVIIARQTSAGKVEYLDAAFAWNEIVADEAAYKHLLSTADTFIPGADVRVYLFYVVAAVGVDWGEKSISCLLEFEDSNGTPYIGQTSTFLSGGENRHDGYKFDPIGLFK